MERNVTLDFVRGVAILGILLLNISAFGLPKAAYLNPARSGSASLSDADTALLDLLAQVKFLTLFALLFGAGLQLLLPREALDPVAADAAGAARFHSRSFSGMAIFCWPMPVGLVSWRMVREAHHVKSLFNTGVVLYLTGIAVLVLLGLISGTAANRSWAPDAANLQYEQYWKLHGGMEAVSNRADMLSDNLLALGAQYGWQLAGMMLMGAALMRSGWLKGQFSLRHYRRTGALLVAAGMAVNLPAIFAQWYLAGLSLVRVLLQAPRELSAPLQAIGYAALAGATGRSSAVSAGGRYRLRRTHGADQLPAADPDLHHPVLSSWAVYALRSSAAAGLCPHLGR